MKIKYLFALILSTLLFSGCASDDDPMGSLSNISVSQSYLAIPEAGGTVKLVVNAAEDWKIVSANGLTVEDTISVKTGEKLQQTVDKKGKKTLLWCKLSTIEGAAGETEITITAPADGAPHTTEFHIACGDYGMQVVNVKQGVSIPESATCADVIAGAEGKTYRVKATVTAIANTTYGNMYLNDGTGEIYVYGTLDANGAEKNFSSLNIEVGDVVEVEGPKVIYNGGVQLKNVMVNSITKSLIKIITQSKMLKAGGEELDVKVAYKSKGAYFEIPSEYADWIQYKSSKFIAGVPSKLEKNPADTVVYKFNVLSNSNSADPRFAYIKFTSSNGKNTSEINFSFTQAGAIVKGTVAAFNMDVDGAEYTLTGVVKSIDNTTYGNMYIVDGTGEAYIYGTLTATGESKKFESLGIKVGDVVTLKGKKASYKGSPQMSNATYVSHISVPGGVTAISVEDFLAAPEDADKYYLLSGNVKRIANTTYGNFDIADLTGSVYVYGLLDGWGGASKNFSSLGIKEGYTISLLGVRTSYSGSPQVGKGAYVSTLYAE